MEGFRDSHAGTRNLTDVSNRRGARPCEAGNRRREDDVKTIAIVGGGFAGTTLLRALDGRLPAGYELLLISDESYTTFNPMLPEAVGASVFPEQVVAPIRQMIRDARFVMGRVTAVDPRAPHAALRDARRRARAAVRAPGPRVRQPRAARPAARPGRARARAQDRRRRDAHPQHGAAPRRAHRARDRSGAARAARPLRRDRRRLLRRGNGRRTRRLPARHPPLLSARCAPASSRSRCCRTSRDCCSNCPSAWARAAHASLVERGVAVRTSARARSASASAA